MSSDSSDRPSPPPPLAIVGVSCRLPGAENVAEFWHLLRSGTDSVREVPRDRWDVDYYYHPDPSVPGRTYARAGGFLGAIDGFDASFFNISPREARQMDPQQRILLELAWEALEDADIIPANLAGSETGVFIGASASDYGVLMGRKAEVNADPYGATGTATSIIANRISYVFDLHGPSFAIDTACSSSLVAVHEACSSLWRGESTVAIAGGIGILLLPENSVAFAKASMLSPTGRCRTFDAGADGYVRSEGGGIVVLKPLAAAVADGNPIHALILGSGVNSDGRTRGIALPNPIAQETLVRRVYRNAGVDPAAVSYVEAHGTGTKAGDRAECLALGRVFGAARAAGDPIRIGSVKSNIGHLEPASGIAGLIKTLLVLRHREVPPTLHFTKPNPQIPFDDLNLAVVDRLTSLGDGSEQTICGVSSFGFGGTNAHVILAAADPSRVEPQRLSATSGEVVPLFLSARGTGALKAMAQRYADLLRSPGGPPPGEIAAAAALRRSHHPHRIATFGTSSEEIAARLEAFAADQPALLLASGEARRQNARLALVFSGNGSQWVGMGRELIAEEPVFRSVVSEIDARLAPLVGWSVLDTLGRDEPSDLYDRTEIAQPALFALQAGIIEVLHRRGLTAEAMVGHSVGEVAAAYAAGALSLEQACLVIARRSLAQGRTAGVGKMAAVGLSELQAAEAIAPFGNALTIAGVNSPGSVTLAGAPQALDALSKVLKARGVFFRLLALDYAFHSSAMDPIEGEIRTELATLAPRDGVRRFVSTVTGKDCGGAGLDAAYWWANIRKPVQFASAIETLLADGIDTFLEIGPHPVLSGYLREALHGRAEGGNALATLRRGEPERDALWMAVARCHTAGVALDLKRLFPAGSPSLALPAYPWQRERHWLLKGEGTPLPVFGVRAHPLLGFRLPTADVLWRNQVDPEKLRYLADHVLQGATVFPGSGFVEMAIAAATSHFGTSSVEVEGIEIRRPLVFAGKSGQWLEFDFAADDNGFRVVAQEKLDAPQATIAVGRVSPLATDAAGGRLAVASLRARLTLRRTSQEHYADLAGRGLAFGPAFQGVAELWMGSGEALARIEAPPAVAAEALAHCFHPALLDACFQASAGAFPATIAHEEQALFVPAKIERVRFYGSPGAIPGWCHATLLRSERSLLVLHLAIADADGELLAEIDGLTLRRLAAAKTSEIPMWHWRAELRPGALTASSADLPAPRNIARELDGELALERRRRDAFTRKLAPQLERLGALYVARLLARTGLESEPRSTASLGEAIGVGPERILLLESLLALAERNGVAIRRGESWALADAVLADAPEVLWRKLVAAHPDSLASVELVASVGEHLEALLRDEIDPEALIYPERDFGAGDQLFDSDACFRPANIAAARALGHIGRATPANRVLRILDLGGGRGVLAATLLPALPGERVDYLFTDPSADAISRAQGRFGDFPFVRYATLDLTGDFAAQGFAAETFDIVVAGHTLHQAAQPAEALARVRSLLRPGGLLVLAEAPPGGFLDFALGIARSWWRPAKAATTTPESALAPLARWMRLLPEAGFVDAVDLLGTAGTDGSSPTVILARNTLGNGHDPVEPVAAARRWLVLLGGREDRDGISRSLSAAGQTVLTVFETGEWEEGTGSTLEARLTEAEDYQRLVSRLADEPEQGWEILYARTVVRRANGAVVDPMMVQERGGFGLVRLAQALVAAGLTGGTRLWVLTRGAMSTPQGETSIDPAEATLWGVARTLMSERPDLALRLIDLDPALGGEAALAALTSELLHPGEEDEVVLRGSARYVHRLHRGLLPRPSAKTRAASGEPELAYRLALRVADRHDGLGFLEAARPEPGRGEVVVRVRAAGLNYRDVLQRVGVLPEEAFQGGFAGNALGMEFAGEIVAVGPDAGAFKIGDGVFGFAAGAFASHVKLPTSALLPKPQALGFEDAATLPVAALTVYYSLRHVARLERGERILIHGAAGGVGLVAIQYAQAVGAEIYASAGTPVKRDFLRRLGVQHVVDSRSLSFADEVLALTGGEGVDIVLNSLAGEALRKGVSLLRPYGRFVELGKRDFWANTKLGLQPFRNNIQFCGVDVDRVLVDRPALAQDLLRDVTRLIAEGVIRPLPHRVFPAMRAADAFRHMQQSRHIGKVVLSFDGAVELVSAPPSGTLILPRDATYLVTGGRDGFGLATAQWLVAKGARHLVLVSRSKETRPEAAAAIERMRGEGVEVREAAVDVTDAARLQALLAEIKRELPPLRGVVHCAAIIEDAALANLTPERYWAILRPKVLGAHHLDRLTREHPLDLFILYSSAVTLFGNPGQTAYVAANMYLEALAEQRRKEGLPGLAVLWDAVDGVGHFARNRRGAQLAAERLGIKLERPERLLERLEAAIVADSAVVAIANLDWPKLALFPQVRRSPRYLHVRPREGGASQEAEYNPGALRERLAAMPEVARFGHVQQLVLGHIATVLRMPSAKLDLGQSLLDLGLDSLMVVELQLGMEQQFGISIPPVELMDVATVADLVRKVAGKLGIEYSGQSTEPTPSVTAVEVDNGTPEVLEDVSEELLGQRSSQHAVERVT